MEQVHTEAKRRFLDYLKRSGQATAGEMAEEFGLTEVAVRQHLQALLAQGLVDQRKGQPHGRGRPATLWSLTEESMELFPDRHGELTVSLLAATRKVFGEKGVQKMLDVRAKDQADAYRKALPEPSKPLGSRVKALARQRNQEGYMAEAISNADGSWTLVEHHCPICEAASECPGLCTTELEVFQTCLGPGTRVERVNHLLNGGDRCAYRIEKRRGSP